MTDPQQPPDKPFIFDYATPERPAAFIPFVAQVLLGFVALIAVCGLIVVAAASGAVPSAFGILLAILVPIVSLGYLAYYAWRYWHWRGFPIGVLVGLGLLGLGLGLCLGMLSIK